MTIYRAHYALKNGTTRRMTFASPYGHVSACRFAEAWSLGDRVERVDALTTEPLPFAEREESEFSRGKR